MRTPLISSDKKTLRKIKSLLYKNNNKEIGLLFGVTDKYIGNFLHRNGIKRHKQKLKKKQCTRCHIIKKINQFREIGYKHRADCLECEKEYDYMYKLRNKNIILKKAKLRYRNNVVNSMLNNAKSRAKRSDLKFNLDIEFMMKRWKMCNGKCELSGLPFQLKVTRKPHPYRPSLDRINNNKGYTKNNIRIILWALNRAINDDGLTEYIKIATEVVKRNKKWVSI